MINVLITGMTGFVGQNLHKHLSCQGIFNINSLDIRNPYSSSDLNNFAAVIHLAGKAHDVKNVSEPEEYHRVNFGKTKELFDAFLNSDCKDFIYFSSVKAVRDVVVGELTEDVEPSPQSPYGKSKLLAEQHIAHSQLPAGKRAIILRPCMIHGAGNKGNLNLLYKIVQNGIPYPLGSFKNLRSFLSIDNLLYVIERLLRDSSVPSGVYNLADDLPLGTNEVIMIMAEASNCKPHIWNMSPKLIVSLARLGDKLNLPFNSERLQKLTESFVVSNVKIKRALNISHFPTSSKEGLMFTTRSFRLN